MARLSRSSRALLAGLGLSLALHLGGLLALGRLPLADAAEDDSASPARQRAVSVDFVPPEEQPLRLGIDESKDPSPNWLGFTDPTEHRAPQAATDQPALAKLPGPSDQTAPVPAEPTATSQETPAPAAPDPAGQTESTPSPPGDTRQSMDDILADLGPVIADLMRVAADALAGGIQKPRASSRPAAGLGDPGEPSDKDSDPVAIAGVMDVVPGHPVAGKGLEIKTVRPRWLNLTQMTSRPNNPTLSIRFMRDGTVLQAEFEPGENTGYEAVDGPLLDAVYAWRATGEALTRLPETAGATLEVKIRVILR